MKEAFSGIAGNINLCQRLGNDILAGTLPHAAILEGPKGSGKHTMAKMIAAALVCSEKKNPNLPIPCQACQECKKVFEGKSPDVITLGCEGKATIGVETVRFLKEDVHIVPNDSDHKIYIIESSDKMTLQAQNALLLTLEEPPSYIHFFLLCENAGLLLETIRSRAPVFRLEPLSTEEIDRYLCENDRRAAQMKLSDPQGYAELLTAADCGIGQALYYLEPKNFAPVRQLRALSSEFVAAAVGQKGAKIILPLLSRFSTKRDILQEQLFAVSSAVRDLILLKKSEDAPLSFYPQRDIAIELCDSSSLVFLYQFYQSVRSAMDENTRNANVRLALIKMALSAHLI